MKKVNVNCLKPKPVVNKQYDIHPKFKLDNIVFAKVKENPYLPAKVVSPNKFSEKIASVDKYKIPVLF